ncbi:MAG: CDP-alcohol phosphatidyltransferase family protein [Acidobacteriota bacterium]
MKHIPNILTAARLLASPYIFWLLWTRQYDATLVWVFVLGVSDSLDGYLARRFNATSRVGAYLDPVADKLLLSGSYLTLVIGGDIPVWLAGLVLGRDALILVFALGALALSRKRRDFSPSRAGKLSTFFQGLYILAVVAAGAGYISPDLAAAVGWVAALFTVGSGLDYARRALSAA